MSRSAPSTVRQGQQLSSLPFADVSAPLFIFPAFANMAAAGFFGLLLLGCGPLAAVFVVCISRSSFLVLLTLGRCVGLLRRGRLAGQALITLLSLQCRQPPAGSS